LMSQIRAEIQHRASEAAAEHRRQPSAGSFKRA
jgi:hypothetical protein